MSQVALSLRVGRWMNSDYKVLTCLSHGRALDVYDVWSKERDCRCIAKVLRADRANDTRAQRALLREGLLLRELSHPHIVRLYEILWQPSPVLILETLTGATLSHIIKNNSRLRLTDLVPLGIHLCSAMHYLHHLSLAQRPGPGHKGAGTRQYLAPEQARGDFVTPATDVWGIGVVLFEAATAHKPFQTDKNGDYEQLTRRAESVRTHCRLPLQLAKVIDSCLEPEPTQRPCVEELAKILNRWT
ncbi:MAG: serine/threonine protein kinase [Nitrospirae bacterium]|nr:MAG: serine/threonine protein kinase [Nitrospirota bacterium]